MTTYAAIYMDSRPDSLREPEPSFRARLIACRVYAAARGFAVRDQYTPSSSDPMQPLGAVHMLLEQVQANPASGGADRLDVIVVYDLADLRNADGKWNPIAELLRMSGLQVEAAMPPHVVATADWTPDTVWQSVARRLFSIRAHSGEPKPKPAAAPTPVAVNPAAWRSFLDLLGDEQRLRAQIADDRQPDELPARADQLAAARLREWVPEWRKNELLEQLLAGEISREELASSVGQLEVQLRTLRFERRQAHAWLAACTATRELEDTVVEIAGCIAQALTGLADEDQQRAAGLLHLRTNTMTNGSLIVSCLLPLVDETQRECVLWSSKKAKGQLVFDLTVPPLGGNAAAPEDYALTWDANAGPLRTCSDTPFASVGERERAAA